MRLHEWRWGCTSDDEAARVTMIEWKIEKIDWKFEWNSFNFTCTLHKSIRRPTISESSQLERVGCAYYYTYHDASITACWSLAVILAQQCDTVEGRFLRPSAYIIALQVWFHLRISCTSLKVLLPHAPQAWDSRMSHEPRTVVRVGFCRNSPGVLKADHETEMAA